MELNKSPVVIIGKNGVGKTNILEALSLLSPGRGLRSAQLKEIGRNGSASWALNANVVKSDDEHNLGVGCESNRKIIKIDHKIKSSQMDLTATINLVWLTPQMHTMFLGSRKSRLNFFDRIVFSFDINHAHNISIYERLKRERSKLLNDRKLDDFWLSSLEGEMVMSGVKIAKSRIAAVRRLQRWIDASSFDYVKITIDGAVEESIIHNHELSEVMFAQKLKDSRDIDLLTKRTSYGVHTSDFNAHNNIKNMRAFLCSTGEQKLILVAIILATIKLDTVLLLDDAVSHLDHTNRSILFSMILKEKCQAWITDTNPDNFAEIRDHVQMFILE